MPKRRRATKAEVREIEACAYADALAGICRWLKHDMAVPGIADALWLEHHGDAKALREMIHRSSASMARGGKSLYARLQA